MLVDFAKVSAKHNYNTFVIRAMGKPGQPATRPIGSWNTWNTCDTFIHWANWL